MISPHLSFPSVSNAGFSQKPRSFRRDCSAFSLVEVALAIGVLSFGLLGVLGVLPVGLGSLRDSLDQAATANITRHLRGELEQLSFNDAGTGADHISKLGDKSFYYTQEGILVKAENDAAAQKLDAYSKATFTVSNAAVATTTFSPTNARTITVTLRHPLVAPLENRKSTVFSLFAARQTPN